VARGIKKRDYEKLDDSTIGRVVELLASEKPISKKEACEILNISYNTSRLGRIIAEYNDKISYRAERKRKNRGKSFSDFEVKDVILSYLKGESISEIASSLYRTTDGVKQVLLRNNIFIRSKKGDYAHPDLIPDENLSEEYNPGEFAWSARYNCVVEILKLAQLHKEHGNVYKIWVYGKHNEFGSQPWYELGKLDFLKTLNIAGTEFSTTNRLSIIERID